MGVDVRSLIWLIRVRVVIKEVVMIVLRQVVGDELRRRRQDQGRTLRDVSAAAAVSLGYLSEVERGQKEASSELLAAICGALDVPLSAVLSSVSSNMAEAETGDFDTRISAFVL
ncbi:unannotated protein [freshwater metagenome]|uniref:Unannotated protein n=1 Tax=freshwater metagenome TaxID=449393 RepID=A0A6J6TI08_9ZZZZ